MSLYVYIAAPWELQDQAARLADFLGQAGVRTTSRWLRAVKPDLSDEWATKCLRDIEQCDVLLAFNPEEWYWSSFRKLRTFREEGWHAC